MATHNTLCSMLMRDMWFKMRDVTKELCYGCQMEQLSQSEHDLCLLASDMERFECTFDLAWNYLSPDKYTDLLKSFIRAQMANSLTEEGYEADNEEEEEEEGKKYTITIFLI